METLVIIRIDVYNWFIEWIFSYFNSLYIIGKRKIKSISIQLTTINSFWISQMVFNFLEGKMNYKSFNVSGSMYCHEIHTGETELSWIFPRNEYVKWKWAEMNFVRTLNWLMRDETLINFPLPTHRTNETEMKMFYSIIFPFFQKYMYIILCINYIQIQQNFPFPSCSHCRRQPPENSLCHKRNTRNRKKGQIFIWKISSYLFLYLWLPETTSMGKLSLILFGIFFSSNTKPSKVFAFYVLNKKYHLCIQLIKRKFFFKIKHNNVNTYFLFLFFLRKSCYTKLAKN